MTRVINPNHHARPARGIQAALASAITAGLLSTSAARSGQIPVSDVPLFLGKAVQPNVFFEIDDSGSMDFELMTDPHWHFCAYDSNAPGREGSDDCGSRIDTGLFQGYTGSYYTDFHYMYDNPDDVYNRDAVFEKGDSVTDNDWRVIAPSFNKLYFNPDETYEPWPGESDQDFSQARSDPEQGKDGYDDRRDLAGFQFAIWEDNAGYDGPRPHRGGASGGVADAIVDHSGEPGTTANSGSHSFLLYGESVHGEMSITTAGLADVSGSGDVTVDYWAAQAADAGSIDPPEANEDLVLEYRDSSGNWIEVERLSGGDPDGRTYNRSVTIDAADNHADLALRFRHSGGTWEDAWYVDDIDVNEGGSGVFVEQASGGTLDADVGDVWPGSAINYVETPNGEIDLWDDHKLVTVNDNGIEVVEVTYSPDASGLNRSTTTVAGATAQGQFGISLAGLQQRIANWYSYYRRRSLTAKASVGTVIEDNPDFRYGLSVINNHNDLFVEVPSATSGDFSTHNDDLFDALKDFDFPGAGTPLKEGMVRTGKYFDNELSGKDDPIDLECQKNFSLLMSDGHYNSPSDGVEADVDGDGISDTLADAGRRYYEKDLSPLPDKVPGTSVDPATYQHLVTFPVAFGVEGELTDTDNDGWPNPPLEVDDVWGGDPTACSVKQCPEKIDDMWHTAFNSKGRFLSAETPQALTKAMSDALAAVAERESSAATVAVNSGSTQSGSRLFQARFNSARWTGDLLAFDLTTQEQNGIERTVIESSPEWRATDENSGTNPDNRVVLTLKPSTGDGIPFRWPTNPSSPGSGELDPDQIEALNTNPDSASLDGKGAQRLEFLRGDRSNETDNGGDFRDRGAIYGDFVNSAPLYVGGPRFLYPDDFPGGSESPYSTFVKNNSDRDGVVYVGGNGGMLRAFDAETGAEEFSYVPSAVFDDLNKLTSTAYEHRYYVDGSPTYRDAYFNGAWHSVLVGGLNAGGQGIYALDITDPSTISEGTADSHVLWEFGDGSGTGTNGDQDLGLTYAKPTVVRLANGEWAAVFGNGYNNTISDGSASSTGNAVLYIVDIETGNLIRKIDTGVGTADDPKGNSRPNGLSSPVAVDPDNDGVTELIYAGDVFGNLWKFDVDSSNPGDWEVAVDDAGGDAAPLFTAKAKNGDRRPITTQPQVAFHPTGRDGLMVYFGTGKYLAEADDSATNQTTQGFYGVWDERDGSPVSQSDLLEQHIEDETQRTVESEFSGNNRTVTLRVTSDNEIDYNNDKGWMLHLTEPVGSVSDVAGANNRGEKAISQPSVRDNRVIFTSILPTDSPCGFGGSSFVMEVSRKNGGRLPSSPFDLDQDNDFDGNDETGSGERPTGIKKKGIVSETVRVMPGGGGDGSGGPEAKSASSSTGEVLNIPNRQFPGRVDRQSWQQLR